MVEHHPESGHDDMFPGRWVEARERALAALSPEHFRILARLVDAGGLLLGRIHRVARDREETVGEQKPWEPLLVFIEADITDTFRTVACGAASLIPYPGWEEFADPVEVEEEVLELIRYIKVAGLAAEHPSVPAEVRRVFREVSGDMAGWGREMADAIRRIGEECLVSVSD